MQILNLFLVHLFITTFYLNATAQQQDLKLPKETCMMYQKSEVKGSMTYVQEYVLQFGNNHQDGQLIIANYAYNTATVDNAAKAGMTIHHTRYAQKIPGFFSLKNNSLLFTPIDSAVYKPSIYNIQYN